LKKVYVAGAYNGDNIGEILNNMRIGLKVSSHLLSLGYAVFSPWTDFQLFLTDDWDAKKIAQKAKAASLEWLKVSDAIFVVPNEKNYTSKGLKEERKVAKYFNIPIFEDIKKMDKYLKNKEDKEALVPYNK